ncbi:helix-turn-helix transcriptional regulator [Halobacillus sp. Marseille-Q1614]|uniref:helix-turn-helix transcriptional regulator n=1 Tax=Halobacillus sp. Marseille-Q1614 TaxID=2709134 RepID=UPI00156D51C8|nr:hypothetical protein [Halobacillus sp. Marseille-Q1614]
MDRKDLNKVVSEKLKLIRVESHYTQGQMADLIGISKKTLIQVEKERSLLSWTSTVAVCSLFDHCSTLRSALQGSPYETVKNITFNESR